MRTALLAAAVLATSTGVAASEELPRRVWHGLALQADLGGLRVEAVMPGGTAEAAGIKKGDLITKVAGKTVQETHDVTMGELRTLPSGQALQYEIARDGKTMRLRAVAKARAPKGLAAGLAQDYGAFSFKAGKVRTLVTRPAQVQGKAPAVLFVPGFTCASYADLNADHPYPKIAQAFAQAGYVFMRAEKPGMGDSVGGAQCETMDIRTEAEAFAAAYAALKARPDVASDQIFIFGHSLGGIIAPMIAEPGRFRGIVTYGASGWPWFDYLVQLLRVQSSYQTSDLMNLENDLRVAQRVLYLVMVEKKEPEAIAALDSRYDEVLKNLLGWSGARMIMGRDVSVMWDLNEVNFGELWVRAETPTLSLFGTSDIEVTEEEGPQSIARFVNVSAPGKGKLCAMPGRNHHFANMGPLQAEYQARARPDFGAMIAKNYDPAIAGEAIAWMNSELGRRSAPSLGEAQCVTPMLGSGQ
jgi:pimeloyl-ACP methyl ester carboxylesterase